jgi:hypothetical protein
VNPWHRFKGSWKPKPVDPAKIDPDLQHMDGLTRSAESLRYSILSIEWWVSPTGRLREWLRHNTRLAAWLVIPAVLVVPVITLLFWQIAKWVVMLTSIAGHLIVLPVLTLVAALVVLVVINIAKAIFR